MTEQFYSLEEAAEQLNFSETVLVRLSQYFKIPRAAYEDVGYLSFKGDLAFSGPELRFFQQAKDRLLAGESLDAIKKRLQDGLPLSLSAAAVSTTTEQAGGDSTFQQNFSKVQAMLSESESTSMQPPALALNGPPQTLPEAATPLREIQDRKPYEKAAEKSFERYKSMHRSGLGKVFENILKEVGSPEALQRLGTAVTPRATKSRGSEGPSTAPNYATLPFRHMSAQGLDSGSFGFALAGSKPAGEPHLKQPPAAKPKVGQAVWEPLIQQAAEKPRSLNPRLKSAAMQLRERAVEQPIR